MHVRLLAPFVGLALLLLPCPALPCSLCSNIRQTPTLRQESSQPGARLILHGFLANPKLRTDIAGAGTTEFHVLDVIKADGTLSLAQRKLKGDFVLLNSYTPVEDAKNPPQYLLFCDFVAGRLDPYRAVGVTSARTADYLKAALALDPANVRKALHFFFKYLDAGDREIAADAFMEFARANDRDIGEAAKELSPLPLRRWLKAATTPEERLGLYSFLLGRCGNRDDLAWFQANLNNPGERLAGAYDGVLGGYIQLHPRNGWEMTEQILREGRQSLVVRLAVVRMLRFYQEWQPVETRAVVLKAVAGMIAQQELVDLAAEDLRRWKMWELTEAVLALYGKKGLDAPIHKRAILRYALCCPAPAARTFLAVVRKSEAELVREIEESLRVFEKK